MSGIELFMALNEWLRANNKAGEVGFGEPTTLDEVREVEEALEHKLPRSYVEFVTTHGVFHIDGDLTGRGSGNDTTLFAPREILKQTSQYRERLAKSKDSESQEILNDGLLFCGDPCREYFHLFVVSSAHEENGEMSTRGYDYQDPANSGSWHKGNGTFASVLQEIVETVKDNAE